MEERNNGIIGKNILIIFEDAENHYSKKIGICTNNSDIEITLDEKHIIPRSRIVRIEVLKKEVENE